MSLIDVTANEK